MPHTPARLLAHSIGILIGSLLCAATAVAALPADEAAGEIRRSLSLLNVTGEEYREGVVNGDVVRPIEYEEARVFLTEAEQRLQLALGDGATQFTSQFAAVRGAIESKTDTAAVIGLLNTLRDGVIAATGVADEVFPPAPPSAVRGSALFAENCAACHGTAADGRGPNAEGLQPPPANFADFAFMRRETPFDFFHIMSVGKPTSAMPAWGTVLTLQDRWDLVSYLWSVQPGASGLAEGQGVYLSQCAGCHGATGDGRGPWSASLLTPAAPLDQPATLARKSNEQLFDTVTAGVPGTAMPGFGHGLSERERWASIAYLRALSLGGVQNPQVAAAPAQVEPRRFAGLVRLAADEYAKAHRPGGEVDPTDYRESVLLLEMARSQREAVLNLLSQQNPAAATTVRGELDEITKAVTDRGPPQRVQSLASSAAHAIEALAPPEVAAAPGLDPLAEVRRLLDAALAAYRDGNPRATYLVSDAYFQFEPIETKLATSAPEITRQVEASFLELRGAMAQPGNEARAADLVAAIGTELDRTRTALAPSDSGSALFFQSLTIILREGFEVVLIVGALLAYVMKSGQQHMRRPILAGAGIGVVLSLITAYALQLLFRGNPAVAEVLEGFTMLLAAVVLFSVSYWLISKAEADKWQRYIQGKVQSALSRSSSVALASAAFLAVYREGVETVLFYGALVGSAGGNVGPIVAGFAAGLVALGILYAAFVRFGRRVPIRPFFLGTSVLLYYLSFVFAGRGIAELQQIGWVPVTPLPAIPRIDLLGIHPTLETCAVQGVLLLLLLYAVYVTLRRRGSSTELALPASGSRERAPGHAS